MVILAGGFYLGEHSEGMASMLTDRAHCAWYRSLGDCVELCRHYLSNETERLEIREQGEAFVRANHTYDQRVPFLLENRDWVNPL